MSDLGQVDPLKETFVTAENYLLLQSQLASAQEELALQKETCHNIALERDRYKALCEKMVKALRETEKLIDDHDNEDNPGGGCSGIHSWICEEALESYEKETGREK
jgi:hypothetical protein